MGTGRALLALTLSLGIAPAASAQAEWLRVDEPADAETAVRVRLLEVRGLAAPRGGAAHDLAVAIDVSDSAVLPSGWDVDGDGPHGRTDPARAAPWAAQPALAARMREGDLDDCVLMAELAAARALLERLDLERDRLGLVAFSDTAEVIAPLGSGRAALEAALDALRDDMGRWLRGTNFGDAIAAAQRILVPEASLGAPAAEGRQRSLLFLSDGEPTLPPHGDAAREHTLWSANAAAATGIRIHAFALGAEAPRRLDVYQELAARTGGRFERLERAGDAIARLRRTDLAGLASLRIVNATTGRPARAVRTRPNGTFDGIVELVPGPNRLVVEAVAEDGARAAAERSVVFDASPARDAALADADRARAGALLEELRRRTQETELWVEMERQRRVRPELQLRADPAP